eukprot:GILJ01031677.1.p2 GENE.GILJ01031677.1~~GILJ01031677.1.p2  ORF type:complete len:102 (-),score=7.08 GILJ01031677.1:241-546(-)
MKDEVIRLRTSCSEMHPSLSESNDLNVSSISSILSQSPPSDLLNVNSVSERNASKDSNKVAVADGSSGGWTGVIWTGIGLIDDLFLFPLLDTTDGEDVRLG